VPLTDLSQNASSHGRMAHWYTGLGVSSPVVAESSTSSYGGIVRLSGPDWPRY